MVLCIAVYKVYNYGKVFKVLISFHQINEWHMKFIALFILHLLWGGINSQQLRTCDTAYECKGDLISNYSNVILQGFLSGKNTTVKHGQGVSASGAYAAQQSVMQTFTSATNINASGSHSVCTTMYYNFFLQLVCVSYNPQR